MERRRACGRMMQVMAVRSRMPRARAALSCPWGRLSMAPPEDLGLIGRADAAHDEAGEQEGLENPAHGKEKPLGKEEQHQDGDAAEKPDIQSHQTAGQGVTVHLQHGHGDAQYQPHAQRQGHRAHGHQRASHDEGEGIHDGIAYDGAQDDGQAEPGLHEDIPQEIQDRAEGKDIGHEKNGLYGHGEPPRQGRRFTLEKRHGPLYQSVRDYLLRYLACSSFQ